MVTKVYGIKANHTVVMIAFYVVRVNFLLGTKRSSSSLNAVDLFLRPEK